MLKARAPQRAGKAVFNHLTLFQPLQHLLFPQSARNIPISKVLPGQVLLQKNVLHPEILKTQVSAFRFLLKCSSVEPTLTSSLKYEQPPLTPPQHSHPFFCFLFPCNTYLLNILYYLFYYDVISMFLFLAEPTESKSV